MSNNTRFAILLTIVFLALELIVIMHHEMWRDELGEWAYAMDCHSIGELVCRYPYPEHPMLWQFMVYLLTRIFHDPVAVQYFHWLIAGAIIFIFAKYSPFTRWQKILFAFGYYAFYEYAAIARPYSTGVLLLFIFCSLFSLRFKKAFLTGLVLFFLANADIINLLLSLSIGIVWLIEFCVKYSGIRRDARTSLYKILIGFLLVLGGCLLSYMQLSRAGAPGDLFARCAAWRITEGISCIYYGFFPIFRPVHCFWTTNILHNPPYPPIVFSATMIKIIISLIIFSYAFFLLLGKRVALSIYVLGTVSLTAFFCLFQSGDYRHNGFFLILFLSSIWISPSCSDAAIRSPVLAKLNRFALRAKNKVLYGILILHFIMGILAVRMEFLYPFSCAKETADFIRESNMDKWLLIGDPHYAIYSLSTLLNKKIWSLQLSRNHSYEPLQDKRRVPVQECFETLAFIKKQHAKVLFIYNEPLPGKIRTKYGLREIASFTGAIKGDENYYLY